METDELRDTLHEAGLSQYQSEAYATLLTLGATSATELADACSVPTARIYDVLRDLEEEGYIETYEQDSLRARACDPRSVLADLRSRAERLAEAAEEIEDRWEAPAVERNRVSIVKRFETVRKRTAEVLREAESEVQLAVTPETFYELRPALVEAVDRGALVELCIHIDPDEGEEIPPTEAFEGAATEVRRRTLPTPFVALVDRRHTCFAPHAASINEYGVLVEDFTMTYVFHWFFQTCLWEIWDRLYSTRRTEPPVTYAGVRELVRDVEPLVDRGDRLWAHVTGHRTGTREPVDLRGEVVDVVYTGTADGEGTPPLAQLAGQVTLVVETDERTVTVGGWGAVVEDVEATRVTLERIVEA